MGSRIAFIGLGGMGQEITKSLVESGKLVEPLVLYNRTKSTADEHSAAIGSSSVASTLEEAVIASDIIWSSVENDEAVLGIFETVLTQDIKGKLFVDSSTISPEQANGIVKRVREKGADFVAMPVMGDPVMASRKHLTCIPAGRSESVARIKPYLIGVIAKSVVDLSGEEPEQASLLKLLGNVLIMTTIEQVAELNVFAEKSGLGVESMSKLMHSIFPNPPHALYNQRMLSGDYHSGKPMVEVRKARALASHVLALAENSGAVLPSYEVAVKHLEVAEEHAGSSADITGIYGAVRLESGLEYKNEKP